jgi:hypothetical protein
VGPTIAVVALAAALAGCGSGGDETSGPLSGEALAARADAICAKQTPPGAGERSSTAFDQLSDITKLHAADADRVAAARKGLAKLDVAKGDRPNLDRLLTAMKDIEKSNRVAADSTSVVVFQASGQLVVGAYEEGLRTAAPLGIAKCPPAGESGAYAAAVKRFEDAGGTVGGEKTQTEASDTTTAETTEASGPGSELLGLWQGRARQFGPGKQTDRYQVRLELRSVDVGAIGGTIDYPKFDCGGHVVVTAQSGGQAVLREQITHGAKRCYGSGAKITVSRSGALLSYRWDGTSEGTPVQVVGRLAAQG